MFEGRSRAYRYCVGITSVLRRCARAVDWRLVKRFRTSGGGILERVKWEGSGARRVVLGGKEHRRARGKNVRNRFQSGRWFRPLAPLWKQYALFIAIDHGLNWAGLRSFRAEDVQDVAVSQLSASALVSGVKVWIVRPGITMLSISAAFLSQLCSATRATFPIFGRLENRRGR
mgnify:FL=1